VARETLAVAHRSLGAKRRKRQSKEIETKTRSKKGLGEITREAEGERVGEKRDNYTSRGRQRTNIKMYGGNAALQQTNCGEPTGRGKTARGE